MPSSLVCFVVVLVNIACKNQECIIGCLKGNLTLTYIWLLSYRPIVQRILERFSRFGKLWFWTGYLVSVTEVFACGCSKFLFVFLQCVIFHFRLLLKKVSVADGPFLRPFWYWFAWYAEAGVHHPRSCTDPFGKITVLSICWQREARPRLCLLAHVLFRWFYLSRWLARGKRSSHGSFCVVFSFLERTAGYSTNIMLINLISAFCDIK